MKFEELQQEWRAVKSEPKSHEELRRMMYASSAWRFRRLPWKEVLRLFGNVLLMAALIIGFDLFGRLDTALPIGYGIVVGLDEYLGLRYLRFLPQKDTMQKTLTAALTRIKQAALISQIVNFLAWIALVLILGTNVQVGTMNLILWGLVLLPLLVAVAWWNSRKWSKKNDEVKAMLKEFGEGTSIPAV